MVGDVLAELVEEDLRDANAGRQNEWRIPGVRELKGDDPAVTRRYCGGGRYDKSEPAP